MKSNVEHNVKEEMDLKYLLLLLWKQKKIIISIMIIITILTGIMNIFVIKPVYRSRLDIVINMPDIYHTQYGDYNLPLTTNKQYIDLISNNDVLKNTIQDMGYNSKEMSVEKLRDRISITYEGAALSDEQNSFIVNIEANNAKETKELAQVLYKNYLELLYYMNLDGAVGFYYNDYSTKIKLVNNDLDKYREILANNQLLLKEIPQTINQEDAMKEINDKNNISEFIVLENIINPNYTKVENDIIINKQVISDLENSLQVYNKYIEELDSVKVNLDNYKKSGQFELQNTNLFNITESNIYLPSEPIEPNKKVSPSIAKNLVISAFLSCILGSLVALFKDYWMKNGD